MVRKDSHLISAPCEGHTEFFVAIVNNGFFCQRHYIGQDRVQGCERILLVQNCRYSLRGGGKMRNTLTIFTALLAICLIGTGQAQVAHYATTFPSVSMPTQVGQQVLLGSLPISSLETVHSFEVQASAYFHGNWEPENLVDLQESFDLYLCDRSDCSGSTRSQIGHVNLAPHADSECLDGVVSLRGTLVTTTNTGTTAVYAGMLDGLWTGKLIPQTDKCDLQALQWGDGFVDTNFHSATGPIGALPWVSPNFVDVTHPLFLALTTTLAENDNKVGVGGTGQIRLLRVVVYP
jgi:hypothetical protein